MNRRNLYAQMTRKYVMAFSLGLPSVTAKDIVCSPSEENPSKVLDIQDIYIFAYRKQVKFNEGRQEILRNVIPV